jgi:hypothetical protein
MYIAAQQNHANFWKKIGKIGVAQDRNRVNTDNVRLEDGTITNNMTEVIA